MLKKELYDKPSDLGITKHTDNFLNVPLKMAALQNQHRASGKDSFLFWEKSVLVLALKLFVYSIVPLLLLLNFKEGEFELGEEKAGLPSLDNALPYQGRLLSGFLSPALA